jgi:hypothetical protein
MNAIPTVQPPKPAWHKRVYRSVTDHLTKWLGVVGAAFMALVAIDPTQVQAAARLYLSPAWIKGIGIVLFIAVFLRGWYTGWKAKQK